MHNSKDNEKTIAIIDDEEIVTDSIYNLLIFETEYNVICFNNPIKAIEELKHRHIDLIVCDVFMKEMNGIEVLKKLRSYHPNVPLIMLTGYADKENTIKAINELSLYYYIEKPWDNDELLLVIKNGIEKGNLIQELKNKMQELESAYVQLEETQDELIKKEKFSTIGNMASKVIHDLKNPMSAISGFAELIIKTSEEKKEDETYKEIKEFAQIIMDEVKRVIGMITEVLQFAKGEEVYRKAALPLTDIIQDTVSAISDKFEKDNIEIELDIASNESIMEIDHDKIMRMMYNLLNNSKDAMPNGGKIKIRIEKVNKD
ncbi:MAG: response regulator, partial [Spirochaetota bacterium]